MRPAKQRGARWYEEERSVVELRPEERKGARVWGISPAMHAERAAERFLVAVDHGDASTEDIIVWVPTGLVLSRLEYAVRCLADSVDIDRDRRGGVPVVRGTRFPVARVMAELADNRCVEEFADDYDLDPQKLRTLLEGFAAYLDRPLTR